MSQDRAGWRQVVCELYMYTPQGATRPKSSSFYLLSLFIVITNTITISITCITTCVDVELSAGHVVRWKCLMCKPC